MNTEDIIQSISNAQHTRNNQQRSNSHREKLTL